MVNIELNLNALSPHPLDDGHSFWPIGKGVATDENKMGILQLEIRAFGNVLQLVQRSQQMRTAQQLGIGHRDLGLRPGVYGQGPVVFHAQRGDFFQFFFIGVKTGRVHQPQRYACRALFQVFFQNGQHLLLFFRGQFAVFTARNAGPGAAMAGQHRDIAGHVSIDGFKQALGIRVNAGGLSPVAEQPTAYLVGIGRFFLKTDGGQAAVACDKRSNALPDERFEAGQAVWTDGEPVVVGMTVDKAGGNGFSLQVIDFVRCSVDPGRNAGDAVIFQQQVAMKGRSGSPVVDFGIFQQNGHRIPRFPM